MENDLDDARGLLRKFRRIVQQDGNCITLAPHIFLPVFPYRTDMSPNPVNLSPERKNHSPGKGMAYSLTVTFSPFFTAKL